MAKRSTAVYALYRGEKNLADGTISELAGYLGVKKATVRVLAGKAYRRKIGDRLDNRLLVIKIGDENDE